MCLAHFLASKKLINITTASTTTTTATAAISTTVTLLLLPMNFLTLVGARRELGDLRVGKLQPFLVLSNQYSFYYKETKLMFHAARLAPFLCQQA